MKTAPRDFYEVMPRVIAAIPTDETTLRDELEEIVREAGFRAPELRAKSWRLAAAALARRANAIVQQMSDAGKSDEEILHGTPSWVDETSRIFSGRDVEIAEKGSK